MTIPSDSNAARAIMGRWQLVLLASLAAVTACSSGADESFRVVALDLDDEGRLILTFSEPVADPTQVDPTDFRLSMARTFDFRQAGAPYVGTVYAGWAGDDVEYLALGPSPTQLILGINPDIMFAAGCDYIDGYLDYYEVRGVAFDMAMLLHYAATDIPIEAASGSGVLANIAPDWVLSSDYVLELDTYGFHNPLRIPCP